MRKQQLQRQLPTMLKYAQLSHLITLSKTLCLSLWHSCALCSVVHAGILVGRVGQVGNVCPPCISILRKDSG